MRNELFGDSRDVVRGRQIWLETRDPSQVHESIEDKYGDIAKIMYHLMLHPGDYENALKRVRTGWECPFSCIYKDLINHCTSA